MEGLGWGRRTRSPDAAELVDIISVNSFFRRRRFLGGSGARSAVDAGAGGGAGSEVGWDSVTGSEVSIG